MDLKRRTFIKVLGPPADPVRAFPGFSHTHARRSLVALVYSLLIILGTGYIARRLRRTSTSGSSLLVPPVSVAVVTVAGLIFSIPYHLQHIPGVPTLTDQVLLPLGKMHFAMAFLVLFGLLNWVYFFRSFHERAGITPESTSDRLSPKLLVALSLCAIVIMLTMGWVRETARAYSGYLIWRGLSFAEGTIHPRAVRKGHAMMWLVQIDGGGLA
jgi:hypothetical protein